ncbi:MAG: CBS domain-containing protein, partial [Pirellulaceae bacterium]
MQSMLNREQSPIDHSFVDELATLEPKAAAKRLECLNAQDVATILVSLSPVVSEEILLVMADDRREEIISAAPAAIAHQWAINFTFPEDSIGRLLDPPHAVFRAEMTVEDCIERIRKLAKKLLITYGYVVDPHDRLIGVVAMRDLLLSKREVRLNEIMLRNPFYLRTTDTVLEAMRLVVNKHFPVYPVCDGEGKLIGTLRGPALFEQHVVEISAQVGKMMGLEKEERLSTPLATSFRFRHPWLQLNLLTAFVAAGVVGYFQTTIDKMVVLA